MSLEEQAQALAAREAAADAEELELQRQQQSQGEFNPGTDAPEGPKLPAAPEPERVLDAEFVGIVGGAVGAVGGILATRRGPHWMLEPEEIESVAIPLAKVIDRYFPSLANKVGPEWALAGACFAIAMPRLQMDLQLAKERAKNGQPQKPGAAAGPTMADLDQVLREGE